MLAYQDIIAPFNTDIAWPTYSESQCFEMETLGTYIYGDLEIGPHVGAIVVILSV